MTVEVFVMSAFAKTPEGGNLAGVVLNDSFCDQEMCKIAKKAGFSETAFLRKINDSHYSLRFFTPAEEVDLCGHATVAGFSLLKEKNMLSDGVYSVLTKAGDIRITVDDSSVYMTQKLPEFYEIIDKSEILSCFGMSDTDLVSDLPVQIVSTGLKDILLPVKSLECLGNLEPDFDKISKISEKYNVIGVHAFCLETMFSSTAHCRNFAPLYAIDEESATGTSNGALACYLFKYGKINREQMHHLVFEQGYFMKRPSEIRVSLDILNNEIKEVCVGGTAFSAGSLIFDR